MSQQEMSRHERGVGAATGRRCGRQLPGAPERSGAHGQGLPAGRGRAGRLRTLAGRGRLRPGWRRFAGAAHRGALRRHHAAAQRDRCAPPRPRGPLGHRGPHGPPGPHAAAARRSGCPAWTTPPSPPSGCCGASWRTRARRRRQLGRERYLERMWRFMERDAPGHHGPAAPPGHLGRLGPRALHHGRSLGAGRARGLQATLRGRPRLPRPEARQLVPGLRHQRLRPGGHRHARGRARCGRSATTCCPWARRPAADPSRDETITVATTRPETILGDTAVAVHPEDPRYASLVGRTVRIPFVDRDVPIIADAFVERDVRHRCREGHARPRPHRLRHRRAPRPAAHRRHDR